MSSSQASIHILQSQPIDRKATHTSMWIFLTSLTSEFISLNGPSRMNGESKLS